MMRAMRRVLITLVAALGCSSTTTAKVEQSCTPGVQQPCPCLHGDDGVQACKDDGTGFNACVCDDGGATGGTTGSGGSGGSGGVSGSSGAGFGGSAGSGTGGSGGASACLTGELIAAVGDNCAICAADACCTEWAACVSDATCFTSSSGTQNGIVQCTLNCMRPTGGADEALYQQCKAQCDAIYGGASNGADQMMACLRGTLVGTTGCVSACF
jgi:hypothetical protein